MSVRGKWAAAVALAVVLIAAAGANGWALWTQHERLQVVESQRIKAQTLSDRGASLRELRRRAVRAEERAERLETRVEALERKLNAVSSKQVAMRGASGELDEGQVLPARDALLAVLESGDEEVQARLRELLRAQRKDMREEWRKKRRERWDNWAKERIATLSKDADLSEEQTEALSSQLKGERDEIVAVLRQSRRKLDFLGGFNRLMDLRRETDEVVKAELDEEQAMVYEAWRREEVDQLMGAVKGVVGFAMRGGPPEQEQRGER